MRRFEFRAWNLEDKIMHTTAFPTWNGSYEVWADNKPQTETEWLTNGPERECILMQFTGLKDKNEKDIYEGDIVGDKGDPNYFVIVWDKKYASFAAKLQNNNSNLLNEINEDWMKELSVIGNVHENPELLG